VTARGAVIELARTQHARLTANAILSVIPGSRHLPGNIRMPPPPDALCDWEPVGYPATVVCDDDEDLKSGFHSFGVTSVMPGCDPSDLFVIAHGERLTENVDGSVGALSLAGKSKWFVLMAVTIHDWASGHVDAVHREDGGPTIVAPYEWWMSRVDIDCPPAKPRWDLAAQAHVLFHRLGVPRDLDEVLFFEIG